MNKILKKKKITPFFFKEGIQPNPQVSFSVEFMEYFKRSIAYTLHSCSNFDVLNIDNSDRTGENMGW